MSDEFNLQQTPKSRREYFWGILAGAFVCGLIYIDGKLMDIYYEKYWPQFEQTSGQQQEIKQQYQQTQMQINARRDTTQRAISR